MRHYEVRLAGAPELLKIDMTGGEVRMDKRRSGRKVVSVSVSVSV
jgi:hypothetical protein